MSTPGTTKDFTSSVSPLPKTGLQWYIIKIISGKERKIKELLIKEIEAMALADDLDEVIAPTQKVIQIRKLRDGKSKKVVVDKNLFPGYMFVHANANNGEVLHVIKNTPSIIGFLDSDKKTGMPIPMRESEVQKVFNKSQEAAEVPKEEVTFFVGDRVKINEGVFHDLVGIINEVSEEKKKIKVMVKIFNRSTPVELNFSQVEKQ